MRINNNTFCFWFNFIYPYLEIIQGKLYKFSHFKDKYNSYLGKIFESIAQSYIINQIKEQKIKFQPSTFGRQWGTYKYHHENKFINVITAEDETSQSNDNGYGMVKDLKIDAEWIGEDVPVMTIEYTGNYSCSIEITGEGTDTDRKLRTYLYGAGASGTEFDLDLTSTSYNTLSKLQTTINNE